MLSPLIWNPAPRYRMLARRVIKDFKPSQHSVTIFLTSDKKRPQITHQCSKLQETRNCCSMAAGNSDRVFTVCTCHPWKSQFVPPQQPWMKGSMAFEWNHSRRCSTYDLLLENLEFSSFPWGQMWMSSSFPFLPSFLRVSILPCPCRRCHPLI